jgi:hypothetical protein
MYKHEILFFCFLALVPISSAHQNEGCCGDVPESLIWVISFLVLVGMLVVVGALFLAPSPPVDEGGWCNCSSPPTVNVRIDRKDLKEILKGGSRP